MAGLEEEMNKAQIKFEPFCSPMGTSDAMLLLFMALKLCDVIDWSWWWVLSPLWITFVLFAILTACKKGDE